MPQTPPRTAVKGPKPRAPQTPEFTGEDISRKIVETIEIPGLWTDRQRQDIIAFIGTNPPRADLIDVLRSLERFIANTAPALGAQPSIDVSAPALEDPLSKLPPRAERRTTASVRRNGDVYASRGRQDMSTTLVDHTAESVRRLKSECHRSEPAIRARLGQRLSSVGPRVPARQPGRKLWLDSGR